MPKNSCHNQFPSQVNPPAQVFLARKQRTKELFYASLRAASLRMTLIILETIGYYFYKSDALLVDVYASAYDIFSSIVILSCVYFAQRPPDTKHPFGHGRLEPIAGMQLAIFLSILGLTLLYQELHILFHFTSIQVSAHHQQALHANTFLFALFGSVFMEIAYRLLWSKASLHDSRALKTEALHYRIDAINNLIATFLLALAALFPSYSHFLDHSAAALIAIFMVITAVKAIKFNLDQILDSKPSDDIFEKITHAAMTVEGVLATEKIRIQHYGPDAHVDIDIEVKPTMIVDRAHKITQHVRRAIQASWPCVRDVTVHIEPFYPNDH